MKQSLGIALISGLMMIGSGISASAQPSNGPTYNLILSGDDLALCSSMAWNHCEDTSWIDSDTMRTDRFLNLTHKYVEPLLRDELWPEHRRQTRDDVADAITIIRSRVNETILPERVFLEEFTRRATRFLYDNLSEYEWNLIIDYLEMPVPTGKRDTARLDEMVIPAKRRILESFIRQAALVRPTKDLPRILVATAGERDPLTAVAPYLSAFREAGAIVEWLPIDAAVNTAQRTKQCAELDTIRQQELGAYNRARVMPQRHQEQLEYCNNPLKGIELVDAADAIFIVGHDQNLVRKAFLNPLSQPTDLLKSIYFKMRAKRLVVGANSDAVNALTGLAMVGSGSSAEAMRSGAIAGEAQPYSCDKDQSCPRNMNSETTTYHPLGGIGLFPYGSLDGQFSDQGRHGRLLNVAAASNTPMAVGIDSRTALAVNVLTGAFEVLGERGVFFGLGAQRMDKSVVASFHYLTAGATGQFVNSDIKNVTFAERDDVVQEQPTTRFLNNRGVVDSLRLLCQKRDQFNLIESEFRLMVVGDDGTLRQKSGGECQVMNARIGITWQPETF